MTRSHLTDTQTVRAEPFDFAQDERVYETASSGPTFLKLGISVFLSRLHGRGCPGGVSEGKSLTRRPLIRPPAVHAALPLTRSDTFSRVTGRREECGSCFQSGWSTGPARRVVFALLISAGLAAPAFSTDWSFQPVDRAGKGRYSSVAMDSDGRPHVSYYNHEDDDLKYARWTGTSWAVETVDAAGDVGRYTSLALDAAGRPFISYYDNTHSALKLAQWTGAAWAIQTVAANTGDESTSLALSTAGRPRITFFHDVTKSLNQAEWTGAAWALQTVDAGPFVGQHNSLALDSAGNPNIGYFDLLNADLKVARWTGAAWNIQVVDWLGFTGDFAALVLDGSDRARIAYLDITNRDLKVARWTGATWALEVVDYVGDVGDFCDLAVDTGGGLHISYYDTSNENLKYAHGTGAAWTLETIDSAGDVGSHTSLALDTDGVPHIMYFQSGGAADIKYATVLASMTTTVGPASSGEVSFVSAKNKLDVTLAVAAGTFGRSVALSAQSILSPPAAAGCGQTLDPTGAAVELTLTDPAALSRAVDIRLGHAGTGSDWVVARYEPSANCWKALASTVEAGGVRARTEHFSLFQVMRAQAPGELSGVQIYPNPLRPARGHQGMTFSNMPAGATLRLYTLSGEYVRELRADGAGTALWDGRDDDGESAASGVYLVRVNGGGDDRTLKVMVQR